MTFRPVSLALIDWLSSWCLFDRWLSAPKPCSLSTPIWRRHAKLHPKLVRSYTLEGLLDPKAKPTTPDAIAASAQTFLAEIAAAEERQFPSLGHGTDHRYKGKAMAGTALVHENEVIHAAFFRLDETEQPERMASYRARRRHGYE